MLFNGPKLKVLNVPGFKCDSGYSVTRRHSTDEMINSSNASYNSDNELVISKEGNRAFNLVKTGLIRHMYRFLFATSVNADYLIPE